MATTRSWVVVPTISSELRWAIALDRGRNSASFSARLRTTTGAVSTTIQPALRPDSTFAAPFYDNITLREYRYYRTRWGYTGNVDYKFSENSDIYVRGLYSNLKDYGDKWYYEPQAASSPKFYTSSKRPDASIGSISAGGRKQFHLPC